MHTAQLVADLLGNHSFDTAEWADNRNGVKTFLVGVADQYFRGEAASLEKRLGVSKGGMHGWIKGCVRPSFDRIIQFAHQFGCGIADILMADTSATRFPANIVNGD